MELALRILTLITTYKEVEIKYLARLLKVRVSTVEKYAMQIQMCAHLFTPAKLDLSFDPFLFEKGVLKFQNDMDLSSLLNLKIEQIPKLFNFSILDSGTLNF